MRPLSVLSILVFLMLASVTAFAASNSVDKLRVIDKKTGDGAEAVPGASVTVDYTGWLYDASASDHHGKKFDSSLDRGEPFSFTLGTGRVIEGWDQGIEGMHVGGKRTLIIPADMAYGSRGAGDAIPPNATLIFNVELDRVEKELPRSLNLRDSQG